MPNVARPDGGHRHDRQNGQLDPKHPVAPRSIEELLHCVGNAMADIDANKNCVAYLAAMPVNSVTTRRLCVRRPLRPRGRKHQHEPAPVPCTGPAGG